VTTTTDLTHSTPTLADEQAAGLRALADLIDANPHIADHLAFALHHILVPVMNQPGPRRVMTDLVTAAKACGAPVEIDPRGAYIHALLKFGPVTVDAYDYQTTTGGDGWLYRLAAGSAVAA
jgi:hypothetical protein